MVFFEISNGGAGTALLGAFGALSALIWVFYCLMFLVGAVAFVVWLWLLIDCVQRKNFPGENDKLLWALILLFAGIIGAILYYFIIKKKLDPPKKKVKGESNASQKEG